MSLGIQGSVERIRSPEGSGGVRTVRRGEAGGVQDVAVPQHRITTR